MTVTGTPTGAVICMLSTPRYPAGKHPYRGKTLTSVDEWPWDDDRWTSRPPSGLRLGARMARSVDPEDFRGALVPLHAIELVEAEHGGHHPLGWVRGDTYLPVIEGGHAPAVYVYAGDFLVAMVSPLEDSPCWAETMPS